MNIVVAIDPSLSHTGLCRFVDGQEQATSSVLTLPDGSWPARLAILRDQVQLFLLRGVPADANLLVTMESQVWSHNPSVYAADAAVYGVLQLIIWETFKQRERCVVRPPTGSSRFLSVNPQQVKKWLGAKEKAEVLLRVYKLYGREFRDHNEADAYTLAVIGCKFLKHLGTGVPPIECTKAQAEVLEKLTEVGLPWEAQLEPKKRRQKKA